MGGFVCVRACRHASLQKQTYDIFYDKSRRKLWAFQTKKEEESNDLMKNK